MIGPLGDAVWLHTGGRLGEHVPDLARLAGGVVLDGDVTGPRADAVHRAGVPTMLQHSCAVAEPDPEPGLFDLTEYDDPDRAWLERQLRRGVSVLTTRGEYLGRPEAGGERHRRLARTVTVSEGLLRLAAQEERHLPRLATIPVDYRWLRDPRCRVELLDALGGLDGAVGLMIGIGKSSNDPLADVRVVEGLVELVRSRPDMVLLRSDHGVLGAYAMGAAGGSIGLGTGARHLVPPGSRSYSPNPTDRTARFLVPALWTFWRGSRFDAVPDDPLYHCDCRICDGRSLARFQDETLAVEADRHSVACWSDVATTMEGLGTSEREAYWFRLCQQAVDNLDELFDRDGIVESPSKQLRAWCQLAGIAVV